MRRRLSDSRRELEKRAKARDSLAWFIRYRWEQEAWNLASGKVLWNWHLDLVCEYLEAQERNEIANLIINWPPGHFKSTVASQAWQAWMIGRDPGPRSGMLSASHKDDLAVRDSIATKRIVTSDWYARLFPRALCDVEGYPAAFRKERSDWWEIAQGAFRQAVGRGASCTGLGAPRLLIDDPIGQDEAGSETVRTSANDWFANQFRNRARPPNKATVTLIMQRFHELDTTGYLESIQAKGGETWEKLCIEEECSRRKVYSYGRVMYERQAGELLFPAWLAPEKVGELKVLMGHNFEGQYNQRPTAMRGSFLQPAWIRTHPGDGHAVAVRNHLLPCMYLDIASKEKQLDKDDPDWCAVGIYARGGANRMYCLHKDRTRDGMEVFARMIVGLWKEWRPVRCVGPKEPLEHALASILSMVQTAEGVRFWIEPITFPGDKIQKASNTRGIAASGFYHRPEQAPWAAASDAEWVAFWKGVHDDLVDVDSHAAMDLVNMPIRDPPRTIDLPRTPDGEPVDPAQWKREHQRMERIKRMVAKAAQ